MHPAGGVAEAPRGVLGLADGAGRIKLVDRLQSIAGNRAVQRAVGRAPVVQRQRRSLAQAVGFETNLGRAQAFGRALHPLSAGFLSLVGELAEAQFVDRDEERARRLAATALGLANDIGRTLQGAGREAQNAFLWQAEQMTYDMMLGELRSAVRHIRLGGYTQGLERHWQRNLLALNGRLLRNISPQGGRGGAHQLPGGKISRKIPLGVSYVPGFIVTIYLNLEVERPAPAQAGGGNAPQTTGSVAINQEGQAEPGFSTTGRGPGGTQLTGGVGLGSEGLSPTVGVGGPSPTRAGQASGSVTLSGSGLSASHEARLSDDVTVRSGMTSDGFTYAVSRSGGSGLSLAGRLDSVSLAAQAPEVSIAGATIRGELELEFRPIPDFFLRSATQTPEVIRAFQRALLAYGVIYALPLVAVAGAAALPSITVAAGEFTFAAGAGMAFATR